MMERHSGLKFEKLHFFLKYFSLFQKHALIFKMGFGMSFHFQNVVLFEMCFHFQNAKKFRECFFPFSKKCNCKQKFVKSLQKALLMRLCKKQKNRYKAFEFVSVVKNLYYLLSLKGTLP